MLHNKLMNFDYVKFYLNNSNLLLEVRIFVIKVKKKNYHK
jgi:hypothetical protein